MTKRTFAAYVAMAASALMVSSVATARAATKPCDVMPERCQYNSLGRMIFYPPGYAVPGSTVPPASGRNKSVAAARKRTFGVSASSRTVVYTTPDIALKSGESTELGDLWSVIANNCKSALKSPPEVEILDGPPGVTAVVNAAPVVPRSMGCTQPVAGGKLVLTAKDIQEYSYTRLTLRVNYKTLDGDRQSSASFNITLFPPK
ncbi:MAG: hypothetical protein WAL80_09230 [Xanthobacteraceae bacterium]|jgi:hypothetical protein